MNQYEAMFLFDAAFATAYEKCEEEIRRLMERAGAEIVFCRQWDDRRLAYKIGNCKRGVYVLCYFRAMADKISSLERDARLAENIVRVLIVRADDITLEYMERAIATKGTDPTDVSESEGYEEPGGGRGRFGRDRGRRREGGEGEMVGSEDFDRR